ncbi:hypothetical protein [Mariniblastus fucicola]|uniref:Uncharacterized protein n=1 Tax=Mariniblastus fucicola TaxID=980251 RepID=A0A5B9PG06_9BACT|nr:hypothetical protein [Mariniblastus fucicola]QEG24135.1 hypothetical protein MFFC18_40510 [Mariniblastus fucicola]
MEPFFPTIWDVFHDGCIDQVEGSIPGTVTVFVGIEYLRKRFSEPGEHFVVTLSECKKFSFLPYSCTDETDRIADFAAIVEQCPGILNAEMDGEVCRVFTDCGVLETSSPCGSVRLDSGREIPLELILETATAYWEEWQSKSRRRS